MTDFLQAQGKSRQAALEENLAVSPSCGFASLKTLSGTGMNQDIQWKKLELVKRLAEEIWGAM